MKVNWRRVRPTSLSQAMEYCLAYAKQKKNLSVDRVADLMGLANKWTLYKWMESGRMPAILIPVFENVCGIDLVTQYLAYTQHKLLIDIPSGKKVKDSEVNEVQLLFSRSMTLLMQFYKQESDRDETIASLDKVMSNIAWHRENLEKADQPELSLFGDDDNG